MKTPEELKTYRKDPDVGPWCVSNGEMNNPQRMAEIKLNSEETSKASIFAKMASWIQTVKSRKKDKS